MKAASQWTQLSDVKLQKGINALKLRSIRWSLVFPALVFLFMNILIYNLLMKFFYIQNRKMCFSEKVLHQ